MVKSQFEINAWKQIEERIVFKNSYIQLQNDLVQLPDGATTNFIAIKSKNYVLAICRDSSGQIVLVRQFRYSWSTSSWEAPAGIIEEGESPDKAIVREISEETGMNVVRKQMVLKYHPMAMSNCWGIIFLADVESGKGQHSDPSEFLEVQTFKPKEVNKLISEGKIIHGPTILAWMVAKEKFFV